jgi:hypothetical protein
MRGKGLGLLLIVAGGLGYFYYWWLQHISEAVYQAAGFFQLWR